MTTLSSTTSPDAGLQEARLDLAAALRWAARWNLHEGVDNHFSLAVPDADGVIRGNRFLINPYGWHWSEITASSLVLCDAQGRILEGSNEVERTAFYIHSRIHLNVPNAVAVMHTHMPYTTALTLLDPGRLAMCEQNALAFHKRIAYDDTYQGLAIDADEGDRLANQMGPCSILFMANHGVTVTGPTVRDALNDLYYLERACMFQVLARSSGQALRQLPAQVIDKTAAQLLEEMPRVAARHFAALKRLLDRDEPEYRD